jgi:hypothetical protein
VYAAYASCPGYGAPPSGHSGSFGPPLASSNDSAPPPGYGERSSGQGCAPPPSGHPASFGASPSLGHGLCTPPGSGERLKFGASATSERQIIHATNFQANRCHDDDPESSITSGFDANRELPLQRRLCFPSDASPSPSAKSSLQRSTENSPSNAQACTSLMDASEPTNDLFPSLVLVQSTVTPQVDPVMLPPENSLSKGDEIVSPLAPCDEDVVSSSSTAPSGRVKNMKSSSKCIQFFTTIVVIVCINTREFLGFSGVVKRASHIFKKVECGLRDRSLFPLPADVSLKELMSMSYFKGCDAEKQFELYCVKCSEPLTQGMISVGDRLYSHKFTDIKKHITNTVLPKYLAILNKMTGGGKKSG